MGTVVGHALPAFFENSSKSESKINLQLKQNLIEFVLLIYLEH